MPTEGLCKCSYADSVIYLSTLDNKKITKEETIKPSNTITINKPVQYYLLSMNGYCAGQKCNPAKQYEIIDSKGTTIQIGTIPKDNYFVSPPYGTYTLKLTYICDIGDMNSPRCNSNFYKLIVEKPALPPIKIEPPAKGSWKFSVYNKIKKTTDTFTNIYKYNFPDTAHFILSANYVIANGNMLPVQFDLQPKRTQVKCGLTGLLPMQTDDKKLEIFSGYYELNLKAMYNNIAMDSIPNIIFNSPHRGFGNIQSSINNLKTLTKNMPNSLIGNYIISGNIVIKGLEILPEILVVTTDMPIFANSENPTTYNFFKNQNPKLKFYGGQISHPFEADVPYIFGNNTAQLEIINKDKIMLSEYDYSAQDSIFKTKPYDYNTKTNSQIGFWANVKSTEKNQLSIPFELLLPPLAELKKSNAILKFRINCNFFYRKNKCATNGVIYEITLNTITGKIIKTKLIDGKG